MEKKIKLTISGPAKKTIKNIEKAKTQNKNSVVIDKQTNKFQNKLGSFRPGSTKSKNSSTYNRGLSSKQSFNNKLSPIANAVSYTHLTLPTNREV